MDYEAGDSYADDYCTSGAPDQERYDRWEQERIAADLEADLEATWTAHIHYLAND